MRILTANIALGLRNVNNLVNNVRGMAAYHSWGSFLVAVLFPPLRGRWSGPSDSTKRINYLRKHENLEAIFELISETDPDIVILNEVVSEIHGPRLDQELKKVGFSTITYGLSVKYPNAHGCTVVATKEQGTAISASMPQLPYPGCGGGLAALRLKNGVSIVGAHMAFGTMDLWSSQLESIATLIEAEITAGNKVIFAGDCNETGRRLNARFSKLGLISVDKHKTPTCPTSLPRLFQKSIDHIYVPNIWEVASCHTINFGSDHLAVCAEIYE